MLLFDRVECLNFCDDDFVLQIDLFDFADHQSGSRTQAADGNHRVGQPDGSTDDLRQHRLVNKIVFPIDQVNLRLTRLQEFLQPHRRLNAGEPST